jgi:hypothetical protein
MDGKAAATAGFEPARLWAHGPCMLLSMEIVGMGRRSFLK